MRSVRARASRRQPDKSIRDERIVKALKMVSEGHWTIRRAAKFAAVTYHEILEKMAEKGIDSGPDLVDLGETIQGRRVKDSLTVLIGKKPRFRTPIPDERLEEQSENR